MTTVPAASISAMTATVARAKSRSSGRTSRVGRASPSAHRAYRVTASARMLLDSRKCSETVNGFRSVSTTMPPSTAWATTPSGCAAASQTRTRRRDPPGRYRQAVIMTRTATTISTKVSIRLVNSM